ncbi:MAG: hypothetical protein HQ582_29485 [Planctomycetes bacterium]|nr:hypothetical protein [Planctomycetota bacterium]
MFKLKPEPGAFVFDQTLRPVDSEGKPIDKPPREGCLPGVSYVQPADEADLEEVVRRAQRDQGASLEARQPADEADSEEVVQRVQQDQGAILEARQPTHWSWKWWFFMLVSVVVLAAVGGLFLSRRFHRARLKRMQS